MFVVKWGPHRYGTQLEGAFKLCVFISDYLIPKSYCYFMFIRSIGLAVFWKPVDQLIWITSLASYPSLAG